MRMTLAILAALLMAPPAFAQKAGFNFFQVETKPGEALRLSDIEGDIKIDGPFAETTVDLGYANSSGSAIQGLFKIQLPHGSVIRDFALRLGDKWQYGTLTEKHKARQTFEEIVRGGADPAVLAWKDGAEYQVRIFPFPAQGKRFIRIRYWQDLQEAKDKFTYRLPLPTGLKLDQFHLKLNIQSRSLDNLEINPNFQNLTYLKALGSDKKSFGAIIDEKQFTLPGEFRLDASAVSKQREIWVGRAAPRGDLNYFGARLIADLPETNRSLPKSLLVFLDTSRSARPDHPKELADILKALTSRLGKNTKISYYEFDASVRKVEALDPVNATYDGGTNFKALLEEVEKKAKEGSSDVLILTDALSTLQREAEFASNRFDAAKIFVLPVKSQFNPHFAGLLADRSGGRVLPEAMASNSEAIVRAFLSVAWRFEGLRFETGSTNDVYPEPGSVITPEDGLGVYFRAKARTLPATATLVVSNGSAKREFKVNFADAPTVPEVENLWAMKKLESLVPQADELEKELAAHASRYQFVSPLTSYIVLESDWDYQRFNISKREENESAFAASSDRAISAKGGGGFGAGAPPPPMAHAMDALSTAPMAAPRRAQAQLRENRISRSRIVGAARPQNMDMAEASAEPMMLEQERREIGNYSSQPGLDGATAVDKTVLRYTNDKRRLSEIEKLYVEKNTPEMKDAWFFIEFARAFLNQGEKTKALRVLSNLFEISEEDGKALRALGLVGCFADQCEFAVAAFRLAMELRPEEPQNYRDLAWLYAEQGRLKDAQATMALVKGNQLHRRFPGMEQILARESSIFDRLARGEKPDDIGDSSGTYAWITWNNDNSDVDFYIRENKNQVIWYGNRQGRGALSFDFTQGYGPEIYTAGAGVAKPQFFVNYCRPDQTSAEQALVVKFATIEKLKDGGVKIRSQVFPLYQQTQFVSI